MPDRLKGKVAIVTGAGSRGPGVGNGKAAAILFAREGARVLCVDRVIARAEETCAMIRSEDGEASVFQADVSRAADCARMVATAVERYGRLKAGVIGLTISLAGQLAKDRIRVNVIAPGMVYTPMVAEGMFPELREQRRRAAPLQDEGTAWDVGWAAVSLASDESRWVTGQVLAVDGGLTITAR